MMISYYGMRIILSKPSSYYGIIMMFYHYIIISYNEIGLDRMRWNEIERDGAKYNDM